MSERTGYGGENVRILTSDIMKTARKRRKVLPASAVKSNSTHSLWQLDKTYRFYCSASGQWVISDEVAFDEKLGTFQSVREYQRAVRPRNGVKRKINFWPQLGVGEVTYKELMAPPSNPFHNPASAFLPSGKRLATLVPPDHQQPEMMQAHPHAINQPYQEESLPPASYGAEAGMWDMASTNMGDDARTKLFDGTVGVQSSINDGATDKFGASSLFDATEATSIRDGTSRYAATERGSAMDAAELMQRRAESGVVPEGDDRVARIAQAAGVSRNCAAAALYEVESMDSVPKPGSKQFSTFMTEFSAKHGFKPDIVLRALKNG